MGQVIHLLLGDCRKRSAELRAERGGGFLGAMVSDPPYEVKFMGKAWDATGVAFDIATWREVFLALEPGGVLKVFSATRTYHRMIPPIEKAGFVDVRLEAWVQGEGFPKGLDISKALDKLAGKERGVLGQKWAEKYPNGPGGTGFHGGIGQDSKRPETLKRGTRSLRPVEMLTAPATEAAKKYEGYNVALKPSWEVIIVARRTE